uniref:Uncharacterized protein n=1 Tax=Chenopodium quinoa TaxID=63459 RepID=A0A803M8I5_CHEQI
MIDENLIMSQPKSISPRFRLPSFTFLAAPQLLLKTDASFSSITMSAGIGCICRDYQGVWCEGMAMHIPCTSAVWGEALVVLFSLKWARSIGFAEGLLLSDCERVVQGINLQDKVWDELTNVYNECRELLQQLQRLSLKQGKRDQVQEADAVARGARQKLTTMASRKKDVAVLMLQFIEEVTSKCKEQQREVLAGILSQNADTEYLKRHGMKGCVDFETFKSKVLVVTYEDIQPDIQRIANGDSSPILCAQPITEFFIRKQISSLTKAYSCTSVQQYRYHYNQAESSQSKRTPAYSQDTAQSLSEVDVEELYASLPPESCQSYPTNVNKGKDKQTELLFDKENDSGKSKCGNVNLKEIREALIYMIIVDELPFKHVEKPGFKHLKQVACPQFTIPSRVTIARDCVKLYYTEKERLREMFKACQRISVTTDTWTSIKRINYMCLSAHFIDSEWKLHKKIINFCPISHKGEAIGKAVEACLEHWGIEDKLFTVTVDNASSNDVACMHLSRMRVFSGLSLPDGEDLNDNERPPEEEDWKKVQRLTLFLKGFFVLTKRISGSHNVTSNKGLSEIASMYNMLNKWEKSGDLNFQAMAIAMKQKFDKYWGNVNKMNKLIYVASILDPHCKFILVELSLIDMHGKEKGSKLANEVDKNVQCGDVDNEVCSLAIEEAFNAVYRRSRAVHLSVGPLEIRVVKNGTFEELMDYAISRGASINQYKVPRCVNDMSIVELLDSKVVLAQESPTMPLGAHKAIMRYHILA